ncbi:oligosaccharide biosynthesis protein Alg14 like-domain-containing protein [Gamsiella multidivaricata]|uniref:oligosaccharide biosynthesis protein Alg14 like-domain-containing protein n=1 Tax=Gamsiella multidivaricata TaxID=101098 RepID=UPI00222086B3|nr:oligosaccharide biosynthesis protein Alg14 like-domain-containing protein [Gamsiella multidivaricata]KAI7822348.1 oligosaccharide biosynthesis protein Alg14 like-domain-containing protein [Gamsiella multidivaricata]
MDKRDIRNLALASVITIVLIALPLVFFAAFRLYAALPQHRLSNKARTALQSKQDATTSGSSRSRPADERIERSSLSDSTLTPKCTATIFLGSGGHTAEMLSLVSGLDTARYTPRHYVVGWDDDASVEKVHRLESTRHQRDITATLQADLTTPQWPAGEKGEQDGYTIHRIPRSRYVHQSMLTTPYTLAKSLLVAMPLIKRLTCLTKADIDRIQYLSMSSSSSSPPQPVVAPRKSVMLMNGPGTCFALALAVIGARMLGVPDEQTPDLVFVESFARVNTLSLAGKLLYPLCDAFLVQWPGLVHKYPRAKYIGVLV